MMSILTNASAASALRLLSGTQRALGMVQSQVSTGLRVSQASDGAAYWSIGVGMTSRAAALGAVGTGLDLAASIVSVTETAVDEVIRQVDGIKRDLVAAQAPGVDLAAVQSDVAARQAAIVQTAESASFNDVNWLVQRKRADVVIQQQLGVQALSIANANGSSVLRLFQAA